MVEKSLMCTRSRWACVIRLSKTWVRFLLEEGLTGLTQLLDDTLSSTDLLGTLDALTFEIES